MDQIDMQQVMPNDLATQQAIGRQTFADAGSLTETAIST